MFNKIKNLIKSHKKTSIVVLIVLLIIGFKSFSSKNNKSEEILVTKRNVSDKVIVTGKVKPAQEVELAFEKTGKVSKVNVSLGDKVFAGQVLVSEDQGVAYSDYLKSKANLEAEKVKLEELKIGTSLEELAIYETEFSNAQVEVSNALTNLKNKLRDALSKSDDAVRNNIDQLFSNPKSSNPQLSITVNDVQLKNDINQARFQAEKILVDWALIDFSSIDSISKTYDALYQMQSFVDKVALAVNALTSNSSISQTTVDGYKASLSTARTNITNAITNLSSAEEKLNTANSNLKVAEKNLALKKRGSTTEEVKAQEARVLQYEAILSSSNAELSKLTLKSPIEGIVTKQDAKVGEIVTAGINIVSIQSFNNFEVETNVSEVSIGKVSVGNDVEITMDAFKDKVFFGTVSYIEPGETVVDGVVNFKVKVLFKENYPEIKTGLTANLDIVTKSVKDVLALPQYVLEKREDKYFVKVLVGKNEEEREVMIGLFGNDGFVEVLSGVSEGEKVLWKGESK